MAVSDLKDDLQALGLALIETHISWVFVGSDEVFKVKRPVDFGFLDFTTLDMRRAACEAEVRLNRRLAPDVYLGVVPITLDPQTGTHGFWGDGEPVDWAVQMRRLPDERRADVLLDSGTLEVEKLDRLAVLIARFHAGARSDDEISRYGLVDAIRVNVEENFEQTRSSIGEYLTSEEAAEIEAWQLNQLTDATRFQVRADRGRVRDGHGDLRLEHVYFGDDLSISVIDCIEFNDRFRYADVCADIAFVAMDLAWHDRIDLAERFVARYAWESNDDDLYSVVDFYGSYRAFVRGKVASMLAHDEHATTKSRERATSQARRYFLLSLAFTRPSLVSPRLVAVGGVIASGKSTVAREIGNMLGAPVISTDRTRKQMLGIDPLEPMQTQPFEGIYAASSTERVYAEVFRRAKMILASGRPVVVDATFSGREQRDSVRAIATEANVPFTMVECTAPREVCMERLRAREESGTYESDARTGVFDDFCSRFESMTELATEEHLVVDTTLPVDSGIDSLQRIFGN